MFNGIAEQALNLPKGWVPRKMQLLPVNKPTHWLVRGYAKDGEERKGDRTFLFSLDKCQQVAEVAKIGTTSTHNGARV